MNRAQSEKRELSDPRERSITPKLPSKVTYLDGLRGIAAFIVVTAHFKDLVLPATQFREQFPLAAALIEHSPLELLVASHLAVLIFFVHSGFVLSWKYLNVADGRVLLSMALRRAFRLGIPIAVVIFFAFALMRLGAMHNAELARLIGSNNDFLTMYEFYPSLGSAVVDSLGGWFVYPSVRYDGALWTMPIELVCSYIVFLILPFVARVPTKQLVLLLLLAAVSLLASYPWLVCFLVGILFVRLYQEGQFKQDGFFHMSLKSHPWLTVVVFLLAIVLALWPDYVGRHLSLPSTLNLAELMQIVSASSFVLLLFVLRGFQRILDWRPVQFMGKLSFAVYLVHLPVMCSLSSGLILAFRYTRLPYLASCLLTFLVTVITIYALSYLMARFVDQWAINFGKKSIARRLYGDEKALNTADTPPAIIHETQLRAGR